MTGKTFKGTSSAYTVAQELGRGGEGQVFELSGNSQLVLKVYNEPVQQDKIRKLRLMTSLGDAKIEQYAAWPTDVVTDSSGTVAGFTMRKLSNYVPLHMLFSPMDRKRIFPEKGYDFLVHVARNLCAAFYTLHAANLVIGDINEGNILVDQRGLIALIDCDSFQVRDGNNYHFCEVGVPRYTPPELLSRQSFANVIRTINTDAFSMAILIFQLLFLGRHPFAGRNLTTEEIDEEAAIKQHLFAYSQNGTKHKLSPPVDSLPIANLSAGLINLFNRAFEQESDRPTPEEWIKELDLFSKTITQCGKNKVHKYPGHLQQCPWCQIREQRNIVYFIDDDFADQFAAFTDIESFVNGFRLIRPKTPKYQPLPTESYNLNPANVNPHYRYYKWYHRLTIALVIAITIFLVPFGGVSILLGVPAIIILHYNLPWRKKIRLEKQNLETGYALNKNRLETAIKEYESPEELKVYDTKAKQLQQWIWEFRSLPVKFNYGKAEIETVLYKQQLQVYLATFDIRNYRIPNFGATRKLTVYTAGIRNAADVDKLKTIKIQGIGPAFEQNLFSWQRQMASTFVYQPDRLALKREFDMLTAEIGQQKVKLEAQIRSEYQGISYLKASIHSKQDQIGKYLHQLQKDFLQAEIDLNFFRKLVG
jgi:DNA-binding helix-hairpin-helix protein with protein kinase domain